MTIEGLREQGITNPVSDLICNRLQELGLSYRAAADMSGGLVKHTTLQRYADPRERRTPTPPVLKGIAAAIDVPASHVQEALAKAGLFGEPPISRFRLPQRADRLSPAERARVIKYIDRLLEASDSRREESTTLRPTARPAARSNKRKKAVASAA